MNDEVFYLRENVAVEPLVNRWYAWSALIPPTTAPLYFAHQAKIMKSFVSAPQVHVAAVKNPALLGGPFLAYPPERAKEVSALLDKNLREQAELTAFAEAVAQLTALLATEGTGFSLQALYARVPDVLRGYVELCYDASNRPTFRFLEGLLYRSKFYREDAQSLVFFPTETDERRFVFSTPRLEEKEGLEVQVPFRSPLLDRLFALRDTPAPRAAIEALLAELGVKSFGDAAASLFSTTAPTRNRTPVPAGEVRVRYLGHACLLIETSEVSVLTDPVISYPYATGIPRYSYADLPDKIDYVVITHAHADHLMFETLLQLRAKIGTIIVPKSSGLPFDPSLKLILEHTGFPRVRELDELEVIPIPGGELTGVPFLGEHGDLAIRSKIAFHVRLHGKGILAAADSNAIEPRLYEHLRDLLGTTDALFLGMECEGAPMSWIYGPLMATPLARKMDQTRRLDGSDGARAAAIVDLLQAKRVFIYAMGIEPWLNHVVAVGEHQVGPRMDESDAVVAHCRSLGIPAERPVGMMELLLP